MLREGRDFRSQAHGLARDLAPGLQLHGELHGPAAALRRKVCARRRWNPRGTHPGPS